MKKSKILRSFLGLFTTLYFLEHSLAAVASPGEWYNTNWGMNPSQVRALYPNSIIDRSYPEEDLVLKTTQNIIKYNMDVFFFFKKNSLYSVLLVKNDYSSDLCVDFSIALRNAYGKGKTIPHQIAIAMEEWYLPKGDINLSCFNTPFRRVGIMYRGKYIEPGL
jgi:hypothetical protein